MMQVGIQAADTFYSVCVINKNQNMFYLIFYITQGTEKNIEQSLYLIHGNEQSSENLHI